MIRVMVPLVLMVMAQPADEPMQLEKIIKTSNLIVIAEPVDANSDVERIDITPAGKKPDGVKYPPFMRHKLQFNVVRVLKGPASFANKPLTVDAHGYTALLEAHRSRYLKGKPADVRTELYQSTLDAEARTQAPKLIVFLTTKGKDVELTANNAYESLAQEELITRLIAQK